MQITYQANKATLNINPKIYPLDVVHSAAYIMIDKAFILLDGDPDREICVEIERKREDQNIKGLVVEFNEELLNYAVYKSQNEKNQELRATILKRVLMTNQSEPATKKIDDPENILKTWEQNEQNKTK